MAARKPPESWFWSHDIDPRYIEDVLLAGTHLMRLSVYGTGKMRRFASISYREPGTESNYLLDVPAAELEQKVQEAGIRPVSITADTSTGEVTFSLVLQKGPGLLTTVHQGLDEEGLVALLDEQHCISDFATYVADGQRKYAALVEERTGPSWVFANVTAEELDRAVLSHGAMLTRVRPFLDGGVRKFTAIGERAAPGRWAWYTDIDGDTLARHLHESESYPIDLEAQRDERGVRYTVVMARDRS
ncbi:MAG: hypothetical protein R3B48_16605 [Kofleriaceae bacterium]